ncbi:chorismate mutase [Picrophilus oshimae]|uniref:Chorismate mutase n=1 Tax=Picrophilus torridus (strain ATCC 700027 / DSM 9790 / JCM 10055 / NBRC 100828 / KAW 2/3) TaxID=1122961 RepID=A0A8G2L6R8_PICTO|nr:chorismate mutase [Picrophilus oshimae]SMD30268.1 chorismate mutase [Picrophilus oshimae DSM 9789]
MVAFIDEMELLRSEIMKNTREIIELIEKRRELATMIGISKMRNHLSPRDSSRENYIKNNLKLDDFGLSILNMIFEFTIHYEKNISLDINKDSIIEVNGDYASRILSIAKIISRPGREIYIEDNNDLIEEAFSKAFCHVIIGLPDRDHHIVNINSGIKTEVILDSKPVLVKWK